MAERRQEAFPAMTFAKAGMIRMTTRLASLAKTDAIRVNCLAPGWIATDEVRRYWESLSADERKARGVPSRLLTTDQIADAVVQLAENISLAGRVLVWWSEDSPRLIEWGDRGYCHVEKFIADDDIAKTRPFPNAEQ
jgi:NAD(P)-dependent dehydrogenase (short-subunit alcohol dehydrogenase family)